MGWWLLQFMLVVPAPVIMAAHIANLLLDAMSQTLSDGNSKPLGEFLKILDPAPYFNSRYNFRYSLCHCVACWVPFGLTPGAVQLQAPQGRWMVAPLFLHHTHPFGSPLDLPL